MTTDSKTTMALAMLNGFNAHDLSDWTAALSEDYVGEYPGARSLKPEQAVMYNQAFIVAFPDIHFDVHQVIPNGDTVVIHWTAQGTHAAPLATLSGQTLPATGRRGVISGMFLVQARDGKITRECTYWDQMELLGQLGLLPA